MSCGMGMGAIATPEILRFRNRMICLLFVLLSLLTVTGCGPSNTYPAQPLHCSVLGLLVVERIISRQVAKQLEQSLGIPVNVINATGGSGVTGTRVEHKRDLTAIL